MTTFRSGRQAEIKKTTDVTLMDQLDELAAFEPNGFPLISLYLNMQPDQHNFASCPSILEANFFVRGGA